MPSTVRTAAAAPRRRRREVWRSVAVPLAGLLVVGLAACGDDVDVADDPADADAEMDVDELPELDGNGMLGLEVTAVGEVSEMLDSNAFRMDKDGVDPFLDESADTGAEVDGDLDPTDVDAMTEGDAELGYGPEQEDVLVLVPDGDLDLRSGDAVRINGTIRALDAEAIEEVYGVAIDEDAYAPYQNQLVVVARTVVAPSG